MDIEFEQHLMIDQERYMSMIGRKTAALMRCAVEMGAILATNDEEVIERMRNFGWVMGLAFQIRDDILGIWASQKELGKTEAGDIYRRKKSLPIIHTFAHVQASEREYLEEIYRRKEQPTPEQVQLVLQLLEKTQAREYCQTFLSHQCQQARMLLLNLPETGDQIALRARKDLAELVDFVEKMA